MKSLITPKPNFFKQKEGSFKLSNETTISNLIAFPQEFFAQYLKQHYSITIQEAKESDIEFRYNEELVAEGYHILVETGKIRILYGKNEGLIHGIQSLIQLIESKDGEVTIPCCEVKDAPKFAWRGMMLDVARHMYTIDEIKKIIDMLAICKINKLHLHITDDQGWRMEIKKYPKLTSVGSVRKQTLIGHRRDVPHTFDGKEYGGFYTQEELKAIVKYAQYLGIEIIPEIDMPGHMQAAISAYPEFGCSDEKLGVWTIWGISDNILNLKDKTLTFLEDVLLEVMDVFDSEYIHIGGDEVPKKFWEQSQEIQDKMKEVGVETENDLQGWFTNRITEFLKKHDKKTIVWDEALETSIKSDFTVMSWTSENPGKAAAEEGTPVILCPMQKVYLDHYQHPEKEKQPLAIGGLSTVKDIYTYEALQGQLSPEGLKNLMGIQGNMWTEYAPTFSQLCYMIFPRLFAIAELGWTDFDKMNFEDFEARLPKMKKILENKNMNYCKL